MHYTTIFQVSQWAEFAWITMILHKKGGCAGHGPRLFDDPFTDGNHILANGRAPAGSRGPFDFCVLDQIQLYNLINIGHIAYSFDKSFPLIVFKHMRNPTGKSK